MSPRYAIIAVAFSSRRVTVSDNGRIMNPGFHKSAYQRAEVEITINGKPVKIEQGAAIIQACEKAGVDVPRFCYHERLAIAGNCRMCLVELEKSPKPVASCAMPVMPGMVIKTDTPLVKKAREGVMEFLLANHPLDCPICDQGGECDLQDQSVRFGSDRSRFHEVVGKRAVENKNLGPLVKTVMTRCIHCTRCVRFANEVAGSFELGTSGRGNDMQIGTYVEKTLSSEMSGNIIDLCPVGALTSKPYAFTARPWELKKTESVDVMDAVGSNIRVDTRGSEVMRILPKLNDDINEEWISDKTRFACDGLKRQRLTTPLIKKNGQFVPATWPEALESIANALENVDGDEMVAIAGQHADAESLVALKDFFNAKDAENLHLDTVQSTPAGLVDIRSNYVLNASINGIEQADVILLVGTNPRHEAAVINTRIRKGYLHNNLEIGVFGELPKLNYDVQHVQDLAQLQTGHGFGKKLQQAKKPLIIVGSQVLEQNPQVLKQASQLAQTLEKTSEKGWKVFNVLQRAASATAAYEVGYTAGPKTDNAKFVYLLNADDESLKLPQSAFVVYQGHHGDVGAHYADVILPGAAYTEKTATFVNTEGRTQTTRAAVQPPAGAREDWKIIRALSEVVGQPLAYDDVYELRHRMGQISPLLVKYELEASSAEIAGLGLKHLASIESTQSGPLRLPIADFYLTDPISRSSTTMAKCSQMCISLVISVAQKKLNKDSRSLKRTHWQVAQQIPSKSD
ncbi:hypothetical protein EDD86DRAFT_252232 [Gorgonomyces haynaldii]|nr:hypothetical protein EDD86DRAFT_252232 [Gorgonomyces haynaldii]